MKYRTQSRSWRSTVGLHGCTHDVVYLLHYTVCCLRLKLGVWVEFRSSRCRCDVASWHHFPQWPAISTGSVRDELLRRFSGQKLRNSDVFHLRTVVGLTLVRESIVNPESTLLSASPLPSYMLQLFVAKKELLSIWSVAATVDILHFSKECFGIYHFLLLSLRRILAQNFLPLKKATLWNNRQSHTVH